MPKILEFQTIQRPRVTLDEVRRFTDTVDIRNAPAFAAELEVFLQEYLVSAGVAIEAESVEQALARKASALRAADRWHPGETDIQRGRAALLAAFEQPCNLPLADFARLANKSRQQIYKDIQARRLLALNVGPRGQRLPDWQLDPLRQQLTQAVLQGAPGVDTWTLYRALSEPLEGMGGRSPVEAVAAESLEAVTRAVFNVLGVH